MLDVIRWYVVLQLFGLAALPYAARFFANLPDRGYAFARPLGLLIVGVVLWFGAIFGLWPNTGAMIAIILTSVALIGWLGLPRSIAALSALWRDQRRHVYVVEALFLGAFLAWAFFRSFFPEIQATEKPMDFLFLNGIIRSQRFPPIDPWLSGNSISYYYLGYLLVAALTELAGVVPSVAFNLAIATLFALTATGAFALTHALADGLRRTRAAARGDAFEDLSPVPSWIAGGLGAWFVVLLGNWEGLLEILHAHGFGTDAFWQWIGIKGLDHPFMSAAWYPTEPPDTWWWFRASRVIADYANGGTKTLDYTINEFPFFSFLLGDMHPHVMALPFAFVCLGYCLSFLRSPGDVRFDRLSAWGWDLLFIPFLFGSLFLLNAWDILTYLFVLMCAFAVRRYFSRPRFDREWVWQSATFGAIALVASLILYWPFYLTFRSQASGLLGIVQVHSHLHQFLIFWGPFVFLAGSLVVAELVLGWSPLPRGLLKDLGPSWTRSPVVWGCVAAVAVGAIVVGIPVLALTVPAIVGSLAIVVRYLAGSDIVQFALSDVPTSSDRPGPVSSRRPDGAPAEIAGGAVPASWATEHVFVFVMLFTAALLLFGTELVFIQDSFNDRMNTVFKLYYQSWTMLAVVGAYAVFYVGSRVWEGRRVAADRRAVSETSSAASRGPSAIIPGVWLAVVAAFVVGAFVYVPASLESRSQGFGVAPTLDGLAYYARFQPDDADAILWLQRNVSGTPVVVEATGGSYSDTGEVAWMTGLPTILGWNFHEVQWRGAAIVAAENERRNDVDTIYRTTSTDVASSLLRKYGATYVYVGPIEKRSYPDDGAGLSKFRLFMDVAYQNPGVTVYKVRGGN